MLISRLYLNLRTFHNDNWRSSRSGQVDQLRTAKFATNRILGNIGAPLKSMDDFENEWWDGDIGDNDGDAQTGADVEGTPSVPQDTTLVPVVCLVSRPCQAYEWPPRLMEWPSLDIRG